MSDNYDSPIIKAHAVREFTQKDIKELAKCKRDIFYFMKYCKVLHPSMGIIPFNPWDHQKRMIETFRNNRFNICMSSRQSGKTLTVGIYVLHAAIFNSNYYCGIASNTLSNAKDFLQRVKLIYENLPLFLRPSVHSYNETSIHFENGSRIVVSSTTSNTFLGRSINIAVFDEFSKVTPASLAYDLWSSLFPTVNAGGEVDSRQQLIIISTPKGSGNLFYDLYMDAVAKRNNFASIRVDWWEVPGRDEEWKKQMLKDLTQTEFDSEYGNKFIGSTNTVIAPEVLERLNESTVNDSSIKISESFDGKGTMKILENPCKGYEYIVSADTGKGVGKDNSVIQVLKIIPSNKDTDPDNELSRLHHVAIFYSNQIHPRDFAKVVYAIGKKYNYAWLGVENNGEGGEVSNILWHDLEYENMINFRGSDAQRTFYPGIRSTGKSKSLAVTNMRVEIESDNVDIFDVDTIKELTCFVELNNGKCEGKGSNDDRVDALMWGIWCFKLWKEGYVTSNFDEMMSYLKKKRGPRSEFHNRKITIKKKKEEGLNEEEYLDEETLNRRKKLMQEEAVKEILYDIDEDNEEMSPMSTSDTWMPMFTEEDGMDQEGWEQFYP